MAELFKFSERLAQGGYNYAYGISAADIAGNGHLDLVTADTIVGLYWLENDGKGNFVKHVIHRRNDEWLERHQIADLNGDGRPEIVSVDNWNGSLLYFQCHGDPRDAGAWSYHYIAEGTLPGAYELTVADIDGDGALEVAASSWRKGNQFAWFDHVDGQWIKHVIDENIGETRTMVAADFNKDGKVDLLGTAARGNLVVWYENPGDPANKPWKKHVIDVIYRPNHAHAVDMDGDGDLDVILAAGGLDIPRVGMPCQIVWYENEGQPEKHLWKKHIICDSFPECFEAVAADLDGDGQMEVVASAWGDVGRIAVFKHRGDPRGPWDMQLLKDGWTNAETLFVADLDEDGRPDIVACAERGSNEVRWWRNEGPAR
jgi:hypothetical protein